MSSFNLTDDTLNAIITKSILDTLTEEKRNALISAAIANLLSEKTAGSSYDRKTQFQAAFDGAVRTIAERVACEKLREDETVKGQLEKLFVDAWKKLTDDENEYENLVQKVANAMGKGIAGDRY